MPYSRSSCLSSLESHPFPVSPPSFSRQRCCSPIRPTASFWPLTPVPLEARAPPHPPGPNPPTRRVSPSAAGLCRLPDLYWAGKALTPCTIHFPTVAFSALLSSPAGSSAAPGAKGTARAGLSSVPPPLALLSRAREDLLWCRSSVTPPLFSPLSRAARRRASPWALALSPLCPLSAVPEVKAHAAPPVCSSFLCCFLFVALSPRPRGDSSASLLSVNILPVRTCRPPPLSVCPVSACL